jgi:RNA polymerase sigma factor (sigma-70 family)
MPLLPLQRRVPTRLPLPVDRVTLGMSMSPHGEGRLDADETPGGLSPAVLGVLVASHDRFLGFLERRVKRRDVAEEILQDAFVRGMAHGGGLREDESAIAWFYRLLRNAIVDHMRSESAEQRGLAALAQADGANPTAEPDPELIDTICACVTNLVGTLKSEYAAAIQRVELDGESLQSFAAAVGITYGNAAVRLFRARQALRRRIEESCGTCGTHGCYQCECRAEVHTASR